MGLSDHWISECAYPVDGDRNLVTRREHFGGIPIKAHSGGGSGCYDSSWFNVKAVDKW